MLIFALSIMFLIVSVELHWGSNNHGQYMFRKLNQNNICNRNSHVLAAFHAHIKKTMKLITKIFSANAGRVSLYYWRCLNCVVLCFCQEFLSLHLSFIFYFKKFVFSFLFLFVEGVNPKTHYL